MSNIRAYFSTCIVCGSSDLENFLIVEDWLVSKEDFQIKNCNNCQFRFTSNPPAEENAGPYYETEEYVEHSDNNEGLTNFIYHKARKWMLKYKLRMISKQSNGKRLLDVGSGSGYFINFMKQNGYDTAGVEISEKAVALCEEIFGIKAYSPQQFVNHEISGEFDIATMWHVFEHVYSYDAYFELFTKMLAKNGVLIIAMPNHLCLEEKYYKKYWNGYDTPRHLWHFTSDTFSQFVNDKGFEISSMKNLPLDPFYNSMISASYKKSFSFLPATVFVGFCSWVASLFSFKKSSSIVYILKKK